MGKEMISPVKPQIRLFPWDIVFKKLNVIFKEYPDLLES